MHSVLKHLRQIVGRSATDRTDRDLLESFIAERDETAFEALVRRHGAMVLGVCRRVVGNVHDADDAFQATFVVLARKAASIGRRELLAGWLYGVAYRTAREMKRRLVRRQAREKQIDDFPHPATEMDFDNHELSALLDDELSRLPEKYRLPIVLCDLQQQSRRDAARQMGIPEGTLSSRLATGRQKLAQRLARRGLALSAAALAVALPQANAGAAVSAELMHATVQTALALPGTLLPSTAVSSHITSLGDRCITILWWSKMKRLTFILACLLAFTGLVGTSAFLVQGKVRSGAIIRAQAHPEPQKKKAPALAQNKAPQPRKGPLRYDGKLFGDWEEVLQTELKPERLVEAVKAMQAFGINGRGKEAAEAILAFAGKYQAPDEWPWSFGRKSVFEQAVSSLRIIKEPAVPLLLKAAKSPNVNVRRVAVAVMEFLPHEVESPRPVRQALLAAARDKDVGVRYRAFAALGHFPDAKEVLPILQKAIHEEKEVRVRREIVRALGSLARRSKATLPLLAALIWDNDGEIVLQARNACISRGDLQNGRRPSKFRIFNGDARVGDLLNFLSEGDAQAKREFFHHLLDWNGERAKNAVTGMIKTYRVPQVAQDKVKLEIIRTLGQIGPAAKEALPLLREAAQSNDVMLREAAAAAIKRIGGKK